MTLTIDEDRLRQILREEFATRDEVFATFATKEDLKQFATKKDLERFATKEDLKRFATKDDLKAIEKKMATKDDFKVFETKLDMKFELKLAEGFGQMSRHFNERFSKFEQKIDDKIDSLFNLVDGFVGRMDADDGERAAMTNQLNRHEKWHHELAEQTGSTLSAP